MESKDYAVGAVRWAVAGKLGFPVKAIDLLHDGDVLADSAVLLDLGTEAVVTLTAVVSEERLDGPMRRRLMTSTGRYKEARADLKKEMDAHERMKCSFECSVWGEKLQRVMEGERCNSPDYNPYGPCSVCRSGRSRSYAVATRCPVAGLLNREMAELQAEIKLNQVS